MSLPRRLAAGLAALCATATLAGCAITKPASTVRPTGWPDPPSASPVAGAAPAATPAPSAPPPTPQRRTVAKPGFVLPLPDGYLDATALITDAPSAGPTRLVAYLRNPEQHAIMLQTWVTDQATLAGFVSFYVTATDAGGESVVTSQRPVTMGGLPGTELTLQAKATGDLSTMFVAMPTPRNLAIVLGQTPDEGRRRAVEQVATGLRYT